MVQVFLSHNHKDKAKVRMVANRLINKGVKVWIDEAEIKTGDSLINKISEGIRNMEFLIAFISKNSINSKWVEEELEIAKTLEIKGKPVRILPVLLDQVDLPLFLMTKKYEDLSNPDMFERGIENILNAIGIPYRIEAHLVNLHKFRFLDIIFEDENLYALASLDNGLENYFVNPDGKRFYEKNVYLIIINRTDKTVNSMVLATDLCVGHGGIDFGDKYIRVFINYKIVSGNYKMCGALYSIEKDTFVKRKINPLFEGKNWGWYPILDDEQVKHFNCDGYYLCINSNIINKADRPKHEENYNTHISNHSQFLLPNNNETIVENIINWVNHREFVNII